MFLHDPVVTNMYLWLDFQGVDLGESIEVDFKLCGCEAGLIVALKLGLGVPAPLPRI